MIDAEQLDALLGQASNSLNRSPSVVARVVAQIEQSQKDGACESAKCADGSDDSVKRTFPRRQWKLRRSLAVTSTIAGTLLGAVALFTATLPPLNAFAQVAQQVEGTQSMTANFVQSEMNGTLIIAGSKRRFDGDNITVISDTAARRELMLDKSNRTVVRLGQQYRHLTPDFYSLFRNLASVNADSIEAWDDESGLSCPGFSGKSMLVDGGQSVEIGVRVWIHPQTGLPIRAELRFSDSPRDTLMAENIQFDVSLDDTAFDLEIPEGFTVVGLTADQLKAPPDEKQAAKLTIVPGVGIGSVRFGMSRDEIVALIGEPEFTQHDVYLCYPSIGLQLVLVGREPDKLGLIIANPGDAPSLMQHDFPGKTDKGIGIGSTIKQVLTAYPDFIMEKHEKIPLVSFSNESLGLKIWLSEGKVGQIMAVRVD